MSSFLMLRFSNRDYYTREKVIEKGKGYSLTRSWWWQAVSSASTKGSFTLNNCENKSDNAER